MQVEKIHELRAHASEGGAAAPMRSGPRHVGVVNLRLTRMLAFIIISIAVMACAAVCILAVWEYVEPNYAWRALASLGIVSAATAVFVSLNEGFGPVVRG